MFDAFGDGWNGNIMSLDGDGTNGGTGILTIAMGAEAQHIVGSCGTVGCTDATACNFDADAGATIDDGSCLYDLGCGCGEPAAVEGFDCDGNYYVKQEQVFLLMEVHSRAKFLGQLQIVMEMR